MCHGVINANQVVPLLLTQSYFGAETDSLHVSLLQHVLQICHFLHQLFSLFDEDILIDVFQLLGSVLSDEVHMLVHVNEDYFACLVGSNLLILDGTLSVEMFAQWIVRINHQI